MAAILLGTDGGPQVAAGLSLYQLVAYNLLIASGALSLRVLTSMQRGVTVTAGRWSAASHSGDTGR